MKSKAILISLLCLTVSGCATSGSKVDTSKLADLQELTGSTVSSESEGISRIRLKALQDTALTLGAQAGLAAQAQDINELLTQQNKQLTETFNFNSLLLQHNVLPPILVEGRDTLNLADNETIRLADRTYQIIQQARFVTTAPNWREYLWLDYTKPPAPHVTLLPQDHKERLVWRQAVAEGWQQGIAQANDIFAANLARLKRDYSGIILYRKLLAQNMVSQPFVAHADLGITGDGSDLRINDQVLRITALPQLQMDSKVWKPAVKQ